MFRNLLSKIMPKNDISEQRLPMVFGYYSSDPKRDVTGYSLSHNTLFDLYKHNSDLSDCINGNAEDTFSNGYNWIDPKDPERDIDESIISELDIIFGRTHHSAALSSWDSLKFQISRDMDITGMAYVQIVKSITGTKILGFRCIDPRTMAIVADVHGVVHRYVQRVGMAGAVLFDPTEIICFKNHVDTRNEIFGLSPIESLFWEVKTDIEAMLSNYYFFKNDAKPSNLFILKEEFEDLGKEEKDQIMDQIKDQFSGGNNRNKSAIMSMIEDVKQLSITQKDMEFLNQRVFTRRRVRSKFRRPEFIDAYTESVNNNNGDNLLEIYWDNIQYRNDRIAEVFNTQFISRIPELAGKVIMKPLPQKFSREERENRKLSLMELDKGVITRRQYKKQNGLEITDSDEKDPAFDQHIIYSGIGAVFPEDIGVDPQLLTIDDGTET